MKKLLLILVTISITAASCGEEKSIKIKPQNDADVILLMEPFFSQNIKGNNLAEEKLADDASKVYLDFLKNDNSLSDYPVFYEMGMKAGNGKSWVKFRTGFGSGELSKIPSYKNYDRINLQLLAKVEDSVAQNLKENHAYFLFGKLVEKGWRGQDGLYEFKPYYFDYDLNFDNVTYKIDSIK